jgi:manganese transport protein
MNNSLQGTTSWHITSISALAADERPWLRRLITRSVAIVPAIIVITIAGESAMAKLLVLSQVILSMQLTFAVFPLVMFTGDRAKMGEFVNPRWLRGLAWTIAIVIAALNAWLLVQSVCQWTT